jgi:hypothetical protein
LLLVIADHYSHWLFKTPIYTPLYKSPTKIWITCNSVLHPTEPGPTTSSVCMIIGIIQIHLGLQIVSILIHTSLGPYWYLSLKIDEEAAISGTWNPYTAIRIPTQNYRITEYGTENMGGRDSLLWVYESQSLPSYAIYTPTLDITVLTQLV